MLVAWLAGAGGILRSSGPASCSLLLACSGISSRVRAISVGICGGFSSFDRVRKVVMPSVLLTIPLWSRGFNFSFSKSDALKRMLA